MRGRDAWGTRSGGGDAGGGAAGVWGADPGGGLRGPDPGVRARARGGREAGARPQPVEGGAGSESRVRGTGVRGRGHGRSVASSFLFPVSSSPPGVGTPSWTRLPGFGSATPGSARSPPPGTEPPHSPGADRSWSELGGAFFYGKHCVRT